MGAELMNDDSVEADAEMIALVVESLLQTGLKEFQLSIGEVEYFKGLCEEAGLSTETAEDLRELISGKNLFGAEAVSYTQLDVYKRQKFEAPEGDLQESTTGSINVDML